MSSDLMKSTIFRSFIQTFSDLKVKIHYSNYCSDLPTNYLVYSFLYMQSSPILYIMHQCRYYQTAIQTVNLLQCCLIHRCSDDFLFMFFVFLHIKHFHCWICSIWKQYNRSTEGWKRTKIYRTSKQYCFNHSFIPSQHWVHSYRQPSAEISMATEADHDGRRDSYL